MATATRRAFLQTSTLLSAAALLAPRICLASPFGLPIGLQLYSVRDLLPTDYEGTLKQIAAAGYTEVEAAGFYHHDADQVSTAMKGAGLRCVSAHYPWSELHPRLDEIIAFHQKLDTHYIICASPGLKNPPATSMPGHHTPLTLEDWRWNAEQFNLIGEKVKSAGLGFGYHNHVAEFQKLDGITPYDELLRITDPALVTFEMDCGWVTVGGGDPIAMLTKHPTRISMLHVKDFKPADPSAAPGTPPKAAELGQGTIDYGPIFHAARKANIKHYFVEQEQFDMSPFASLKIDADYMRKLEA